MQTFEVKLKNKAKKELASLSKVLQKRIWEAIEGLAKNPIPRGALKLEGKSGLWRIRVGEFRIIYEIIGEILTIYVVKIAPRDVVYQGL